MSVLSLLSSVARAGVQSGTIMAIADTVTQTLIENNGKSPFQKLDMVRTARWAVAGFLLHGPYFSLGFRRIDQIFGPAKSLPIVAYKTFAAQFVLFPPYLVLLFSYFGLVEHGTVDGMITKVRYCVLNAFVGGCCFWPLSIS